MRSFFKKCLIGVYFCGFFTLSTVTYAAEVKLDVLWQTAITGQKCAPEPEVGKGHTCNRGEGIVLHKGEILSNGRWLFLASDLRGNQSTKKLFILDLRTTELLGVPLALKGLKNSIFSNGKQSAPQVFNVDVMPEGRILVTGYDDRSDSLSAISSRGYVAELDISGQVLSEIDLGQGYFRRAYHAAVMDDGAIIVSGEEMFSGWAAFIRDGAVSKSDTVFGVGKGIAMAAAGNESLIVGIVGNGKEREHYREDVAAWLVDSQGEIKEINILDKDINRRKSSRSGVMQVRAAGDGYYILSGWSDSITSDPATLKPLTVTKLDKAGKTIWQKKLMDTIGQQLGSASYEICDGHGMGVLENGDLLVACSMREDIHLYRFSSLAGEYSRQLIKKPSCAERKRLQLMIMVGREGDVFMAGSRPGNNVAGGCSWLARLAM